MTSASDPEQALGLRRVVVETAVGPVVARVAGSGPEAVLLLHGAAGSWRDWLPLLAAAADAGRPIATAVALDLPGWGESPDPVGALDADGAAAAAAAVARAVGAERWTVVGHSLGGIVALALAQREPATTRAVVLVSPTGPAVLGAVRHPLRGGLRLPWFAGMLLAMRALAVLPGGGRGVMRALGRWGVLGPLSAPLFADRRALDPAVAAAFGDAVRPRAFVRAVRSAAAIDPAAWRAVRCPVRSVRGAHDVFVGRRDAAAFDALLPDFAEDVIAGAGHFALVERPEAVLHALETA